MRLMLDFFSYTSSKDTNIVYFAVIALYNDG